MSQEMLGALGLGVVAVLLLGFFIFHALCLALSAKIVSLPNRTFLKAFGCSLLIFVAGFVLNLLFTLVLGPVGFLIALIVGFFLSAGIISGVYRGGYGAGLGAAIISWVFSILFGVAVALVGIPLLVVVLGGVSTGAQEAKASLSKAMLEQLKGELTIYQISNGALPASLQDIKGNQAVSDAFANTIQYRVTNGGRGFELLSYGADGRPGGTGSDADITVRYP